MLAASIHSALGRAGLVLMLSASVFGIFAVLQSLVIVLVAVFILRINYEGNLLLIFVMTGGGPANSTQILSTYIFTTAFRKLDFGYASAIAVALLGLLLIYAAILLVLRRKLVKI